jgi:catechol 2,3-dioxygenase-like lactoylglutathione lyase family enzyme
MSPSARAIARRRARYGPKGEDSHYVYLCPPHDGKPAVPANGSMLAFKAHSQEEVNAAYAAGMANGGSDEGAPGFRPPEGTEFYGAYLRDPTGNKLCVYFKS